MYMWTSILKTFKKELIICTTIEELTRIRKKLDTYKINYDIRTVDLTANGLSHLANHGDSRSKGTLGLNMKYTKQFYIYVRRNDYEKAFFIIQKDYDE